ncbi:sigma-70 family RNA polymerase sigma factor [Botrimarina sp.]|uniref:sigma-70 family RNA polymerase sigma factor n=1 Tax=Botrimarina sp. TaxID=2795802 RepID=UPI0032EDB7F7
MSVSPEPPLPQAPARPTGRSTSLGRIAPPAPRPAATDGELLAVFVRQRDEDCLARLFDRHADMVWRVCRGTLRRQQDAEDAFQATFLLLVKNARSIQASESAAGWLYRVAHRTSLAARRRLAARREEALALDPHAPSEAAFPDLSQRQNTGVLLEELRRLPERYQTPLVLRYLEGQSRRAIAEQTDSTVAAVQGRLARGKQLLRRRLLRRGVSLSLAFGALAAKPQAAEAAPASAVAATTSNSTALAAGGSLAAGVAVVHLVREGARAMLFASLGKPAAAVVGAALVALATLAPEPAAIGAGPADGAPVIDASVAAQVEPAAPEVVESHAMTVQLNRVAPPKTKTAPAPVEDPLPYTAVYKVADLIGAAAKTGDPSAELQTLAQRVAEAIELEPSEVRPFGKDLLVVSAEKVQHEELSKWLAAARDNRAIEPRTNWQLQFTEKHADLGQAPDTAILDAKLELARAKSRLAATRGEQDAAAEQLREAHSLAGRFVEAFSRLKEQGQDRQAELFDAEKRAAEVAIELADLTAGYSDPAAAREASAPPQPRESPLEKIVRLRREELKRLEGLYDDGLTSRPSVIAGEVALAEAIARLADTRSKAAAQTTATELQPATTKPSQKSNLRDLLSEWERAWFEQPKDSDSEGATWREGDADSLERLEQHRERLIAALKKRGGTDSNPPVYPEIERIRQAIKAIDRRIAEVLAPEDYVDSVLEGLQSPSAESSDEPDAAASFREPPPLRTAPPAPEAPQPPSPPPPEPTKAPAAPPLNQPASDYFNPPPLFAPSQTPPRTRPYDRPDGSPPQPLQPLAPPSPNDAYSQANQRYGYSVRQLQRTLNEKMGLEPPLAVDGDYGPKTELAVREFQRMQGLERTGQADAATREKLGLVKPSGREQQAAPESAAYTREEGVDPTPIESLQSEAQHAVQKFHAAQELVIRAHKLASARLESVKALIAAGGNVPSWDQLQASSHPGPLAMAFFNEGLKHRQAVLRQVEEIEKRLTATFEKKSQSMSLQELQGIANVTSALEDMPIIESKKDLQPAHEFFADRWSSALVNAVHNRVLGELGGTTSGDPTTDLRWFQQSKHLDPTGELNEATWNALFGLESGSADEQPGVTDGASSTKPRRFVPRKSATGGSWTVFDRPSDLNPDGWAVKAELAPGATAPIPVDGDTQSRPQLLLVGGGDDAVTIRVVDAKTDRPEEPVTIRRDEPQHITVRGKRVRVLYPSQQVAAGENDQSPLAPILMFEATSSEEAAPAPGGDEE